MASPTVVDELVVTLTLDAQNYQQAQGKIEIQASATFKRQQERARQTDRMNKDQQKRLKDVSAGVKAFAGQVTAAVGIVTGLGAAVGATLTGFLNFETGLRRQAVGTAMSNKEMQAWGATARRLGADANAGAEAIASLAKERQQFELTGNAPTMQALARMGVNVDRGRPLDEVLAQAQQIYRAAPAGQRQQYENTLAAQGVSSDLILMIKSERDVRDAFTQSLAQSTEENRKALDQLADSLESMKATAISVSATLLEALQPAIEEGAKQLDALAKGFASFLTDVQNAGGGAQGLQAALDKNVPLLGRLFEGFRIEARLLSEASAVVRNGFRAWGELLGPLLSRFGRLLGYDSGSTNINAPRLSTGQRAALAVSDWWTGLVGESRAANAAADAGNPAQLPRNIEDGSDPRMARADASTGKPISADAQSLMAQLTAQYGLTPAQAAAVVSNWEAESSLKPGAVNTAGGGTGARGLAQWRGARSAAFKARYGVMPDQGTVAQQVEFAMTDPYERALMLKSFAGGGSAQQLGVAYSKYYEAHGNTTEDARRGARASEFATRYGQGPSGSTVNIQTVNVQSNNPAEFAGGLQRLDGTQPYNTAIR